MDIDTTHCVLCSVSYWRQTRPLRERLEFEPDLATRCCPVSEQTALRLAVECNDAPLVRVLLELHADPNASRTSMPILNYPGICRDFEMLQLLVEHKADIGVTGPNSLLAHITQWPEGLRFVLDQKVDPNTWMETGMTPILAAADNVTSTECVELLLERNADIHAVARGTGMSSLHRAAVALSRPMCMLLLNHGLSKRLRNNAGKTAAMLCAAEAPQLSRDIASWSLAWTPASHRYAQPYQREQIELLMLILEFHQYLPRELRYVIFSFLVVEPPLPDEIIEDEEEDSIDLFAST